MKIPSFMNLFHIEFRNKYHLLSSQISIFFAFVNTLLRPLLAARISFHLGWSVLTNHGTRIKARLLEMNLSDFLVSGIGNS